MGGDVVPAALAGVARHEPAEMLHRRPDGRQRRAHAVEQMDVAGGEPNERDEVRRIPQAGRVRLGQTPAAA